MLYLLLLISMALACGDSSGMTTALPTTTTGFETPTTGDASTSTDATSTTWITTAPTTGEPPTCSADMCEQLDSWCHKHGITDSICSTISERICPGDPCEACDMAPRRCKFGDDECKAEAMQICAGVDECECSYSCEVGAFHWPEDKQISFCYVYPWIIGEWCDQPDEAQCLDVMQGPCAPTACEYFDCLEALKSHPCEVPPECAAMHACGNLR